MTVEWKGETMTFGEAAKRIGTSPTAARDYYRRHKTLDGCGAPKKGRKLVHLESHYHTLDPSIPLDCCVAAAGYRSIRQFCRDNNLSDSLVGCWRRGIPYNYSDNGYRSTAPLADEMVNHLNGISVPLARIMAGTGCLEWELFPDVFNETYYSSVYRNAAEPRRPPSTGYDAMEHSDTRRTLKAAVRTLPDGERLAVELFYGLGPTMEELPYHIIAKRLGVSRERVRQILAMALKHLRMPSRLVIIKEELLNIRPDLKSAPLFRD